MPNPSWENLDEFFLTDVDGGFATAATVTLLNSTTKSITGIFDDPYLMGELGEYDMDNSAPRFWAKETELVGIERHCTIVIDGKTYDILTNPQSDGTGLAMLKLAIQGG